MTLWLLAAMIIDVICWLVFAKKGLRKKVAVFKTDQKNYLMSYFQIYSFLLMKNNNLAMP